MEDKKIKISHIIITGIIGLIIFLIWITQPSDELIEKIKRNFYNVLSNQDIEKIVIDVNNEFGEAYKIEITENDIIEKIINAAKKNYGEGDIRGGFKQDYTIRIKLKDKYFNFGYTKMDVYKTNVCMSLGIYNYYNDCGRIFLYEKSNFPADRAPYGAIKAIYAFVNVDLIPVLKEYVDKKIKENPEKYKYEFNDEW